MPTYVFTTDGALLEVYTIGIDLKIIVKGQKNSNFRHKKWFARESTLDVERKQFQISSA